MGWGTRKLLPLSMPVGRTFKAILFRLPGNRLANVLNKKTWQTVLRHRLMLLRRLVNRCVKTYNGALGVDIQRLAKDHPTILEMAKKPQVWRPVTFLPQSAAGCHARCAGGTCDLAQMLRSERDPLLSGNAPGKRRKRIDANSCLTLVPTLRLAAKNLC